MTTNSTPDRKLGSEWLGWRNKLKLPDINANTRKRVYFGILFLCLLILTAFLGFVFYLIQPRLSQLWPWLPHIIGLGMAVVVIIAFFWYFITMMTVLTGKTLTQFTIRIQNFLLKSFPWVFRLGKKLGINRDRLSNSIIKVSNAIMKTLRDPILPEELVVFLPRCLQKSIIQEATLLCNHTRVKVYVVAGGSKAREIIYKERPKGVIGVACERDLMNGIREVLPKIPVIGIPNTRPEGPCHNTLIDVNDLHFAIQCFLGRKDLSFVSAQDLMPDS